MIPHLGSLGDSANAKTVLSKKNIKNRIVLSFKDNSIKPLGLQPLLSALAFNLMSVHPGRRGKKGAGMRGTVLGAERRALMSVCTAACKIETKIEVPTSNI